METIAQGTLVIDRYRMIREIGLGGMGTVWLAYDQSLDSHCALKLIGASQAQHQEARVRFECEAKCAAQLRGGHVVDVLNRGEWEGKPFIVMEYLEGEDLAARLERVGRLDAGSTYRIVAQVARALMRAHALGIVHRDIKPGNVFLVPGDEHEVAKLLDFGVAKHRDLPNSFESPDSSQLIGTPCYMSPEQAGGLAVDARSDLWALAVVTFECLTGQLPFQDESLPDLIHAITHGPVPSLAAEHPELPEELEPWWRLATAHDPKHRFQSAKEFADSLAEALGVYPLPVSGFPPPNPEAPTILAPLPVAPASRRPALVPRAAGSRRARPESCQTDGAVTMYSEQPSSAARFAGGLHARSARLLPYVLGAAGLGALLALATAAWRPALNEVAWSLGFEPASQQRPLPQMPHILQRAQASRGELQRVSAKVSLSPEAAITAACPVAMWPVQTAEPTVLLVTEPQVPSANAGVRVKKPRALVNNPIRWRALAPPAELAELTAKDYGI